MAFGADGSIADAAGTHMHSITGTITGLIDYGILVGDETIIEGARSAYDVGMRPFRSSYGWVKEFRWAPLACRTAAGGRICRLRHQPG